MNAKYYVEYIEDSTPYLKSFETKASADKWIAKFKKDLKNGNWIELYFYGEIYKKDPYYGK